MSIKPEELKQSLYISRENFQRAQSLEDEYAMHKCYISKNFVAFGRDDFVALQAIPDTHRVVSVELLEKVRRILDHEGIGETASQLRAIIEDKP